GQNGASVLRRMAAVAENELVIVLGKLQGRGHLLVGQRPVAGVVIQIIGAILEKDADRLARGLADLSRIDISAADVREAADMAQDFAKQVGAFPGRGEGTDASRAE